MTLAAGKTIIALGVSTNYFDQGEGEPVLLLHGSGIGVSAKANWGGTIPVLAEKFRVVAPDIAGFALSDPDGDPEFGLPYWSDHIAAFLDGLNIASVGILGNSFGGALALAFAIRHPRRVRKLMLMGTAGVPFEVRPVFGAGYRVELSQAVMREQMANFTEHPGRISEEMVAIRLETALRPETKGRQGKLFRGHGVERVAAMCSRAGDLARIEQQTLLVHGRDDKIVPTTTSRDLQGLLKNADLHMFANCGHWSHIDRKADFDRLAIDFLG
jgi:pimeloyl-ACP methyl ester carboxylesterase